MGKHQPCTIGASLLSTCVFSTHKLNVELKKAVMVQIIGNKIMILVHYISESVSKQNHHAACNSDPSVYVTSCAK